MASVERKYALSKLGPGDWLLPDNGGRILWRICRGQSTEGWELWRWRHTVSENAPAVSPEWADWDHVQSYHDTRDEAIGEALRIGGGK